MDETGVNHPVRGGGSAAQAVQILKIASMRLSAGGEQRLGGRIRASKTKHLMARVDEFRNNGGADKSCGAGDENTHGDFSSSSFHGRVREPCRRSDRD
jgi:hypothetical protein